ncbi:hypothetical protein IC798_08560 [Acinetobacter seifertii]|uniref:hypothetical protein n=1 Tax=Acinetobacter seifertii TaxID=1530123 RepID=UPI00168D71F3|nr:hypothetical protein [Acinetobacter seifertii]QNX03318.1 hypothetical protein IC798_08560 [Acinetobacter seifertii]
MDNKNEEVIELVNHLKFWFDEKINTISGAANSDAKTISFTGLDGSETANIEGRDKNMFLLGMRSALHCLGNFPIEMTSQDGSTLIATNDSNRLEFLVSNRLRVEKWNVGAGTEKYFVYNDEDELVSQDFTSRDAIDLAIQKYETPDEEE